MQFIKFSRLNLPPQGCKIVCFRKGDVWIARRLRYKEKDYYLEIPYGGKFGSICTDIPEYWMPLDLPEGYTGYIRVSLDEKEEITIEELERIDKKIHSDLVGMMIEAAIKNGR